MLTICVMAFVGFLLAGLKTRSETLTLAHFEELTEEQLPGLTVVIAARDEKDGVRDALESLLALDYPDLEVVFVDDRSSDGTFEIATDIANNHPGKARLRVLRCETLPADWLGKLHALHLGVKAATKPLILLTDADVVYEPRSLRAAVSAQRVLQADHLVVAPQIETRGFWEPLLVAFFLVMFTARFRPHRVHKDRKSFVGVGAFNLLTREAIERCEYLEPLRLQVIDDVHLGRLIKSRGLQQFCLVAQDGIRVRWFQGLRGCITGLEKNAYAGLNYSLPYALSALPFVSLPFWLPILLFCSGQAAWGLTFLGFLFLLGALIPGSCRLPRWIGIFFPFAALALSYTFLRSAIITERQGGVKWRGTLYPLHKLREAHHNFIERVAPL